MQNQIIRSPCSKFVNTSYLNQIESQTQRTWTWLGPVVLNLLRATFPHLAPPPLPTPYSCSPALKPHVSKPLCCKTWARCVHHLEPQAAPLIQLDSLLLCFPVPAPVAALPAGAHPTTPSLALPSTDVYLWDSKAKTTASLTCWSFSTDHELTPLISPAPDTETGMG